MRARKGKTMGMNWRVAQSVRCPHCDAGAGWPCRGPDGYGVKTHKKREAAAIADREAKSDASPK
jgi:hypothetical protein